MCKPACCGNSGPGLTGTATAIVICAVITAAIIRALLHLIEIIALVMLGTFAVVTVIAIALFIAEHWQYHSTARQPVPGTDEWLTQATETLVAEINQAQQTHREDTR